MAHSFAFEASGGHLEEDDSEAIRAQVQRVLVETRLRGSRPWPRGQRRQPAALGGFPRAEQHRQPLAKASQGQQKHKRDKDGGKKKKEEDEEVFEVEAMDLEEIIVLLANGQLQLYQQFREMVAGPQVTCESKETALVVAAV